MTRSDALNVVFTDRKGTVLSGLVNRSGRKLFIELCFNRTFAFQTLRAALGRARCGPTTLLLLVPAWGAAPLSHGHALDAKYE
jgi:hypothetical protein